MELGGKNPAIVMESADLDAAAEGVTKSAWGLQNQKCSACSRVYVHRDVADNFVPQTPRTKPNGHRHWRSYGAKTSI